MENRQIIITTSWDDGHVLDFRIAELLQKYGLSGTFYVPVSNDERPVMDGFLLSELSRSFEIGGHTVHHRYLRYLRDEEARKEIFECKSILQDHLGRNITAFCFPGGKYSLRDVRLVKEAGFLFGRTTRLLRTNTDLSSSLLDTSVQAYHHSSRVLAVHSLRNMLFPPGSGSMHYLQRKRNFVRLAADLLSDTFATGKMFHLWGHSWEVEQFGLWESLEDVLRMISFCNNTLYLNNTEAWKKLSENV